MRESAAASALGGLFLVQPDPKGPGDDAERRARDRLQSRKRGPDMTVLSFQISDRQVEIAVPGGPLTKGEIALIRQYLELQAKVAPELRADADDDDGVKTAEAEAVA